MFDIYEFKGIRYAKYLILPVVLYILLIFSLVKKSLVIRVKPFLLPFYFLVLYSFFSLTINFQLRGVYEIFFIITSVLPFSLVKLSFKIKVFDYIDISLIILFLIRVLTKMLLSKEFVVINFIKSKSSFETVYCYIFAMFSIVYFLNKRIFFFLVNLIVMLLAFKRISLVAMLIITILILLPRKIRKFFLSPFLLTFMNLLIFFLIILFARGTFGLLIEDIFGVSANVLSMGRENIYKTVITHIGNDLNLLKIFLGNGFGYATFIAIEHTGYLLHSDILKIFLENGLVFSLFFFFIFYKVLENDLNRIIALYFNLILITENVIIYSHVLFFYFLIQEFVSKVTFEV